nr:MAG TPA: hypothetical protein [Bacteriophage sp.]
MILTKKSVTNIQYIFAKKVKIHHLIISARILRGIAMKEKIKIISDGEKAEVYIDGKKVRCTDMELHFIGHVNKSPMIKVDARWNKTDENGNVILNEDKTAILTEGIKINC